MAEWHQSSSIFSVSVTLWHSVDQGSPPRKLAKQQEYIVCDEDKCQVYPKYTDIMPGWANSAEPAQTAHRKVWSGYRLFVNSSQRYSQSLIKITDRPGQSVIEKGLGVLVLRTLVVKLVPQEKVSISSLYSDGAASLIHKLSSSQYILEQMILWFL